VASTVTLNFSKPHESIYKGAKIFQVIVPGVEGEYGVTPNHVPYVAQLKPGVLQILHEEGSFADSEKYFVAGGYALTHDNSVTVRTRIRKYDHGIRKFGIRNFVRKYFSLCVSLYHRTLSAQKL
jgi:F0F1-type ATP synthase epsilon subunit